MIQGIHQSHTANQGIRRSGRGSFLISKHQSLSAWSVQRRSTWINRNQANVAPAPAIHSERSNAINAKVLAPIRNALRPKRLYWRNRSSIRERQASEFEQTQQRAGQAKPARLKLNKGAASCCHRWAEENRTKTCTQSPTQTHSFTELHIHASWSSFTWMPPCTTRLLLSIIARFCWIAD